MSSESFFSSNVKQTTVVHKMAHQWHPNPMHVLQPPPLIRSTLRIQNLHNHFERHFKRVTIRVPLEQSPLPLLLSHGSRSSHFGKMGMGVTNICHSWTGVGVGVTNCWLAVILPLLFLFFTPVFSPVLLLTNSCHSWTGVGAAKFDSN